MNNFCATILLAGVLLATLLVPATGSAAKDELLVYFGTFTKSGSKGIYLSRLDRETGKLSEAELAAEIGACGFLAIHPNKKYLYSVGDLKIPLLPGAVNRSSGSQGAGNAQDCPSVTEV